MKILLKIVVAILILVVFALILAFFVPKDYRVERQIVINKSNTEIFDYVKQVKNQDNFNIWVMADPQMKKEFVGTDGTVGFIYKWNGNDQVGEGEQEIKSIVEGYKTETELRFKRPFESVGLAYFVTESTGPNETKVIWGMNGNSKYPMNLMNLFIDKMLGKDMDTSLQKLKTILEK